MVAPSDPPFWGVSSDLSNVPDACHARRTVKGHTFALELDIHADISDRTVLSADMILLDFELRYRYLSRLDEIMRRQSSSSCEREDSMRSYEIMFEVISVIKLLLVIL